MYNVNALVVSPRIPKGSLPRARNAPRDYNTPEQRASGMEGSFPGSHRRRDSINPVWNAPDGNLPPSLSRQERADLDPRPNPFATGSLVEALAEPPSGALRGLARAPRPRKATHKRQSSSGSRHPSSATRADTAARAAHAAARQQALFVVRQQQAQLAAARQQALHQQHYEQHLARSRAIDFAQLPPPTTPLELEMRQSYALEWGLPPPPPYLTPAPIARQPLMLVPVPRNPVPEPMPLVPSYLTVTDTQRRRRPAAMYPMYPAQSSRPQDRTIYQTVQPASMRYAGPGRNRPRNGP
ncbi:hypothetical protein FB451DRAFT_1523112 [Mycena latifolia]|nr:hypothetical protein FB451DRAFT_1523112 [Mycena latifolia]